MHSWYDHHIEAKNHTVCSQQTFLQCRQLIIQITFTSGRQGARLKKIEASTNTKINVPRPDDSSEFIRVTGNKEGADKARHEIQSIADEMVCICGSNIFTLMYSRIELSM